MGVLTDGRQYDEKFRRAFFKKLSKQTSEQPPDKANDVIKAAAHSISVHLYEVKIWMISYRIVFQIERIIQSRGGNLSQAEIMKLIQTSVLAYLTRNRTEKKYRFVKILLYLFQVFNIKDKKAATWLH